MLEDIERVLISQYQIMGRIKEMADQITRDYVSYNELTIVPILTGGMIFCADLIRQLPMKMKIGLMTVSSYPGASLRTQGSQIIGQQLGDIHGRHILLVDDILDSGSTVKLVVPALQQLGAASVKVCMLLRKDRPAARETQCDYMGFEIPDEFIVGYGLDYNNYYRNLPDVVTLTKKAIEKMR